MDSINLHIVFADGSESEVDAVAADMVAFEAHFDLSIAKLSDDPRLTYMFWLAWHAQKRTGLTVLEFDKWLESVQGIKAADPKE